MHNSKLGPIHIAMVGKYTGLGDSYLSVVKALEHASIEIERRVTIDWVEATDLEPVSEENTATKHESAWKLLKGCHGILVPGGFGDRGVEGMILASQYARSSGKPYLGICLGMQVAVIEFARNQLGWTGANSEEFTKTADPAVIVFMPEISKTHMGATMRLGTRKTVFSDKNCITAKLYNISKNAEPIIEERHRHRYEVNPEHVAQLQKAGLRFVGSDPEKVRMGVLELDGHDFFVGTQAHPEFKSRPRDPSPLFVGLLLACWRQEIKKSLSEGALVPMLSKWNMNK
jgi:CTP synthase